MNCRRARHLLFDFFDGVGNEALRAEVDRHLGECEACDVFASEMTKSLALLRRVPVEPLDENFNWKVRLAIHREKNAALDRAVTANAWVRAWNLRYALSGGLAFGAVLVVGGVLLLRGGIAPTTMPVTHEPASKSVQTAENNGPVPVPRANYQVPANDGMMSTVSAGNSTASTGAAPIGAIDENKTDARIDSLISSDVMKLSTQERDQYLQRRINWFKSRLSQQPQPQH